MKDKPANLSAKSAAERAAKFKEMDPRNAFDMWLNRKLRNMFDRVADEPLPNELVELVRKLEDKEKNADDGSEPARPARKKQTP